ncbi:MAG: uL15 family ribosomal protein, partial [Candidatus Eisenbacteria bacterium]
FEAGSQVTPAELREAGLIRRSALPIKLLGDGALDRALTVRVHAASQSAVEKISQSGGKVELLTPTPA